MCKTDSPRSVIFLFALWSYSCWVKSMHFSQISLLFLTELHSRDAVCDIAGMLLGILKRLRTSCWRIMWKEKIQHDLSIYPLSVPFRFFDFLLGNILGEIWSSFTCHLKKLIFQGFESTAPMLNIKIRTFYFFL